MNDLPLIKRILLINIVVISIYILSFVINNYFLVSNQLKTISNEKIISIYNTIEPIVSINLTLGMEKNYKSIIDNTLKVHDELIDITLLSPKGEVIYTVSRENSSLSKNIFQKDIYDSLLDIKIAQIKLEYTFSNIYSDLLSEYISFLIIMVFLFILILLLLTLVIRYKLYPLKKLLDKIRSYQLEKKNIFSRIKQKDEISQINNMITDMLQKIEKEVEEKIYLEHKMMIKDRFASMGEMLDNIAHQWRQPLMKINAILLNMDIKLEEKNIDKKYLDKKIKEISDTTQFMSQTIDVFREYINPNKKKDRFELVSTINRVINLLKPSVGDINIDFKYDKEYEILGIKNELIQVLLSLLNNSIDALEKIEQKKIKIELYTKEDIVISIEDNGKGIPMNIIEKIFDPYFTTKHKKGGTGLGLYISKLIVTNSLNGTIGVLNTKNGTKFIIKIKKGK